MQGGPSLDDLRAALVGALNSGDSETIGDLFHDLPDDLRRPVEILGLLHLASRVNALDQVASHGGVRSHPARRRTPPLPRPRRTARLPTRPTALARLADLERPCRRP